jgi:hypothetical protein
VSGIGHDGTELDDNAEGAPGHAPRPVRAMREPRCMSCDEPIRWVVMPSGALTPLDVEPRDDGTIVITTETVGTLTGNTWPRAIVLKRGQPDLFLADQPRYVSHFATCPNAAAHRRRR